MRHLRLAQTILRLDYGRHDPCQLLVARRARVECKEKRQVTIVGGGGDRFATGQISTRQGASRWRDSMHG